MKLTERLKEETTHEHKVVERSEVNRVLFSEKLDIITYQEILKRYYIAFHPLEMSIIKSGISQEIGFIARAQLILDDLEALSSIRHDIKCEPIPMDSHFEAIGAAYVIQGSHSGAPFIKKRLLKILGERKFIKGGIQFFSAHENEKFQVNWPCFKRNIDTLSEKLTETQKTVIVNSAQQTFKNINFIFSETASSPASEHASLALETL